MMVPETRIVYRLCKCGEVVYSEPCAACGTDETEGLEGLQAAMEDAGDTRLQQIEKALMDNHRERIGALPSRKFKRAPKRGRRL